MLASALCGLLYIRDVGTVSGWVGLPGYESYIPRLQKYAELESGLALILPFLAALLLGLGKGAGPRTAKTSRPSPITCPEVSHEWTAATAFLMYLFRLAISALASVAFIVVYYFVVLPFLKPGAHAH